MTPGHAERGDSLAAHDLLLEVVGLAQRTHTLVDKIDRHVEKMEVILLVREPTAEPAANAYEGLRKQVVAVSTDRLRLLSQLVQFDAALRNKADNAVLHSLVDSWFEEAGLQRIEDLDRPDRELLFGRLDAGGASEDGLEMVDPAYVDVVTGRVVRQGQLRGINPQRFEASHDDDNGAVDPQAPDASAHATGHRPERKERA
jgi:hypothetical protein